MMNKAQNRLATLKAQGIDTSNYFVATGTDGDGVLLKNENGSIQVVPLEDEVVEAIYANGYVKNTMLHRRWVMAQMFEGLNYTGWRGDKNGYNDWLRDHGYRYQWKMVLEEVRVISKLEKSDAEAFRLRSRWFTNKVVADMMKDYLAQLKKYVDTLHVRHCKGVEYYRISKLGDVFKADLSKKVYNPISALASRVENARTYREIYNLTKTFVDTYLINVDFKMSSAFIDAYKGSGAYFTCDNLIKFHGCKVGAMSTESAIKYLDTVIGESYKHEGWRMFAFMKKLISDYNFDFNKRMKEIYG